MLNDEEKQRKLLLGICTGDKNKDDSQTAQEGFWKGKNSRYDRRWEEK